MAPLLEITGLQKDFGGFRLADVTFSVEPGTIMGLIGPNGAGKTTIIKLILDLIGRDDGEIRVFGMDNRSQGVRVRERIGFVFEEPAFYRYLRVERMKSIIAGHYRNWDEGCFQRLCREFELPLKRMVGRLSRGMKAKFALALALSHRADLLILDEPTAGLDPVFRREFLERLLAVIQDEGKSVLFSTHITSDLERIADSITYIRQGKVLFSTPKDQIFEDWAIVKGGEELLTQVLRPYLRGFRQSPLGVKALVSDAGTVRKLLRGSEICFERVTFDELVYFLETGDDHD